MEYFDKPMIILENDHKYLIKNIPCGVNNNPKYTTQELIQLSDTCCLMPNDLVALKNRAELQYCLGMKYIQNIDFQKKSKKGKKKQRAPGYSLSIIKAIESFNEALKCDNSFN